MTPIVMIAQDNVRVDEAVVLLPEETADTKRPGQHLCGDDDQPGDARATADSR